MFTGEGKPLTTLIFDFFLYFLRFSCMYTTKYGYIYAHQLFDSPHTLLLTSCLFLLLSSSLVVSAVPTWP